MDKAITILAMIALWITSLLVILVLTNRRERRQRRRATRRQARIDNQMLQILKDGLVNLAKVVEQQQNSQEIINALLMTLESTETLKLSQNPTLRKAMTGLMEKEANSLTSLLEHLTDQRNNPDGPTITDLK